MVASIASDLLTLSRAAVCPTSRTGAIFRELLLFLSWAFISLQTAYEVDPDNMRILVTFLNLDRGELSFVVLKTACLFLLWNVGLLSCLYILAISDAALLCILKLSGRKSDIPSRWVTQWVTPAAARFRALLVYLYPGMTGMVDDARGDVERLVYMGEHEGHCSSVPCSARVSLPGIDGDDGRDTQSR